MLKPVPEPKLIPYIGNQSPIGSSSPVDLNNERIEEFLNSKSFQPNTRKNYRSHLLAFITWADCGVAGVTSRKILAYKVSLEQAKKSPNTVAARIASLRSFYQWMLLAGHMNVDPTVAISCPTPPELLPNAILPEHFRQVLNTAYAGNSPERDLTLLWLLAHGLRASEAAALNVEDFDGHRVTIHQAKQDSIGTVPIAAEGARWIQFYIHDRTSGPLLLGESNRNRGRLGYEGIKQICQRLSTTAGVRFTAHSLRHTFGTQLMLKGLSAFDVQTLLRHRSPASTRRYTLTANQRIAEENFRKLDNWLD